MIDSWEYEWFYFGDTITLLQQGCRNESTDDKRFPDLRDRFGDFSDFPSLKREHPENPGDISLFNRVVRYLTREERPLGRASPRYNWTKDWRLPLFYHEIEGIHSDELILTGSKCILPKMPLVDTYNGFDGNDEPIEKESQVPGPKHSLYVHTLLLGYEGFFVKNGGGQCQLFKNPGMGTPQKDSIERKRLLIEFAQSSEGLNRPLFDLPDDMEINLKRGNHYSDNAIIKFVSDSGGHFVFEFGGKVRLSKESVDTCFECDNPPPNVEIAVNEYPCGGFNPRP